jgi:acetoin:2,6-dichlorophenolindophenol oxidoreductase subunit beta
MITILESLNQGLVDAMETDPRVYLLGEDILDPYGGAFKVTRGLSTRFPGRILSTPISEAGFTGLAIGMALRGLRPVVEIMFGDFLTLATDQLVNHASKFRWMYNEQVRVPMVIRTPMGGRRGYGPTHSQTLESLFIGVPGLRIVAPSNLGDAGKLLRELILNTEDPLIFVENKLLYLLKPNEGWEEFMISSPIEDEGRIAVIRGAPPAKITLATYGFMAEVTRKAALRLAFEHEIFTEIVIIEHLAPIRINMLIDSVDRTGKLLTIEEGVLTSGWGAEIIARVSANLGKKLLATQRVAAVETPIPASKTIETTTLPDVEDVVNLALQVSNK